MACARVVTALLLCAALSSCGGSDATGPDTSPPTVTWTSIDDGATDVGLLEPLRVIFSKDMDPSTLCDTTVVIAGRSATGTVVYDEAARAATFMPDTLYAVANPHYLVVTTAVTDAAGVALAEEHAVPFTTGALQCEHLDDHLEPNDSLPDAAWLEIGEPYAPLSICGDDVDVYMFTLSEPSTVVARADVMHADAESLSIGFIAPDGIGYAPMSGAVVSAGDHRSLSYPLLAGPHGIRVIGGHDAMYVLYALTLELSDIADAPGGGS